MGLFHSTMGDTIGEGHTFIPFGGYDELPGSIHAVVSSYYTAFYDTTVA